MNKQMSLSGMMDELSQARTKKKEFLEQMKRLIPWGKGWRKSSRAITRESAEISPMIWITP